MERTMRNTMYLIFFVLICFGCEKKENQNSMHVGSSFIADNANEKPIANKIYTLQEQIENYDDELFFLFQEEGNFTNSGNTEILAFYQSKSLRLNKEVRLKSIDKVYCFICDETNQIIKAIKVKGYVTLENEHLYKIPMDILGREIRWRDNWLDNLFGYIGDFNENGKEELYFYESLGMGIYPAFYEFQEDSFKRILDYDYYSVHLDLVKVDTEKKELIFEGKGGGKPENISFIWNKDNQIYEKKDHTIGGSAPIVVGNVTGVMIPHIIEALAKEIGRTLSNQKVTETANSFANWLGDGTTIEINKHGEKIFLSKDKTRKIMFDMKNPYPHNNYGQAEQFIDGKWQEVAP
jgi:hypothetical protein